MIISMLGSSIFTGG